MVQAHLHNFILLNIEYLEHIIPNICMAREIQ